MAKIKAKVMSVEKGMREYDNIVMIRIKSKKYNLLIMEDYMPVLGEVDGSLQLITETEEIAFESLSGFYLHSHNLFELLVKEENYV